MQVVSGYEIRQIRGEEAGYALVLHMIDTDTLVSATTLRMVGDDPAELFAYVKARTQKFGEKIETTGKPRRLVLGLKGVNAEDYGKVSGHSVTIDEWHGLRGWSWIDVRAQGGRVNVPVLTHETAFGDLERRDGESQEEMVQQYLKVSMETLRSEYPIRSGHSIRVVDGIYRIVETAKSRVDPTRSEELRA